jgi:hypothetical protein
MMGKHLLQKSNSQLLIYQTESGDINIEVRLEDETLWLTQKLMADLFQVGSKHYKLSCKRDLQRRRTATGSNYSKISNSSKGRKKRSFPFRRFL